MPIEAAQPDRERQAIELKARRLHDRGIVGVNRAGEDQRVEALVLCCGGAPCGQGG